MAFAAWLPKVRYHSEHFNERTWICYHQAPPWVRVVAHVGDAGQAKPHLEHNPLSLLGTCHAMALRKLNDPARYAIDIQVCFWKAKRPVRVPNRFLHSRVQKVLTPCQDAWQSTPEPSPPIPSTAQIP